MSKKIKVLHILCSNQYSGAENVICQIIGLFNNDTDFEFVYASPDGPIRETLYEQNIKFASMSKATIGEFKRVIDIENPDIIHSHDMRASFLAALVCGKIPLISHIHNNNFDSQKISAKAILYKYAANKAKHIFWVSKSSFTGYRFHKNLEEKSTILCNVINPGELIRKAEKAEKKISYDVVYIGRLTYQKNPQRLINVLSIVAENYPQVKCAIIGDGDLSGEVNKIISEKHLEKNIYTLGFLKNPYGILMNSKVLVMTSRWEGTPMCAIEAMILGIPIVSTPTDGLVDLVENGITGILSNDDNKLAESIIEIMSDDTMREKMGYAAQKTGNNLMDLVKYKNQIEQQYRKSL